MRPRRGRWPAHAERLRPSIALDSTALDADRSRMLVEAFRRTALPRPYRSRAVRIVYLRVLVPTVRFAEDSPPSRAATEPAATGLSGG